MPKEAPSYLDLPDDELGEMPTDFGEAQQTAEEPAQEVNAESEEVSSPNVTFEQETEEETEKEEQPEVSSTEEKVTEGESKTQEQTSEKAEEKAPVDTNSEKEDSIDYKAEYERLTAPFKANGKDVAVKSVDDAIALMQMGANYSKKTAGLKPHLKVIKMLEKHDLLDESKLSYLIDLHGRNPAAITKLVKDSGLDPMEMDTEKATDYKPQNYSVDDREIELDSVLDEIKESPNYQRTLSTIASEWDAASKQVIAGTPALLKVINSHMDSGIYDLIQKEMESERLFGRLQGLSDIEAYRQIGDAINARGGFEFLAKKQQTAQPRQMVVTKPSAPVDDKVKDQKRAAAPVKAAPATKVAKDFSPLALSDEEFAKIAKTQFI
jgi:hypothetical protein